MTAAGANSRRRCARTVAAGVLSVLSLAVWTACAQAAAPPGPAGPPPQAGTAFPLPPAPGQAPGPQPTGPASSIPPTGSGPGLLSGIGALNGKRLVVRLACTASGSVSLSVPAIGAATLAQAKYKCSKGRGKATLSLPSAPVRQIVRSGSVLARLSFRQGNLAEHLSMVVGTHVAGPSMWTSVFGLRCGTAGSYQAQLLAPNFTDTPATTIDVRPWIAWYTAKTGWQWLGTAGPGRSAWYRWTATPSGVAEWQQTGAVMPWTWAPISVSPGHGTSVVAVLEAIYWYAHPSYVWQDARSGPDSNTITQYCDYP
jgi:hypothetical protein